MGRDPTKAPKPADLADHRPPAVSIPTRIVTDDVITDVLEEERPRFFADAERCLELLAEADPALWGILRQASSLEEARDRVFAYLETASYMVPIARLLQERKEEARLLPGLDRTDEPVFNVPRLGKNHLRAFQDHRLVMILADGSRVYELHPWEKNITPMPPYNYVDVPIYDYLERLAGRGEDLRDYRTIWYYY